MDRKHSFKISIFLSALILFSIVLVNAFDDSSLEVPDLEKIINLHDNKANSSGGGIHVINSGLDQNFLEREFKDSLGKNGFLYRKDKEMRFDNSRRLRFDRDDSIIDINLFDLKDRGTKIVISEYFASDSSFDLKDLNSLVEKQSPGSKDIEIPNYSHYNKFKSKSTRTIALVDVPPPPDSEPVNESLLSSCGSGCSGIGPGEAMYLSRSTFKQIESFYRDFFKRNGFEVKEDMNFRLFSYYRRVRFERSDMAVEIYLVSRADNSCGVKVVKYADRNETTEVEANPFVFAVLPKEDNVDGLDFNDIPRPQGSVRWFGTAKNNRLSYLVPMTVLEARKFYLEEMPDSGWRLIDEMDTRKVADRYTKSYGGANSMLSVFVGSRIDLGEIVKNSYMLFFNSDSAKANIMIYQNYVRPNSGSIVDISYARKDGRR